MKKVFLIFGTIGVVLVLLLCAFVACDESVVPSASAEVVPSIISSTVVKPNLLPFYDFSGTLDSRNAVYQNNAIYADYSKCQIVGSSLYVNGPSIVSIYFNSPGDGYGFSIRVLMFSPIGNYCDYSITNLDINSTVVSNSYTVPSYASNTAPLSVSINTGNLSVSIPFRLDLSFGGATSGNYIVLYYVKLESFKTPDALSSSSNNRFTGFILPDYSYITSSGGGGDEDPLLGTDLITFENKLNGSDYYQTPYYYNSNISSFPLNVWFTDLPSSAFDYIDPNLYPVGFNQITFSGDNSPYTLRYRYNVPGASHTLIPDLTFTLCFRTEVRFTVTISTTGQDAFTTIQELVSVSDDIQLLEIHIEDWYEDRTLSIDIDFAPSSTSKYTLLYYSKLEYSDRFSGYVLPDHDISFNVRDNLLDNWAFSSVPELTSAIRYDGTANKWFSTRDFIYRYTVDGLVLDNSDSATIEYLFYRFQTPIALLNQYVTFTLRLYSDTEIDIYALNYPFFSSPEDEFDYKYFNSFYLVADNAYSITASFVAEDVIYFVVPIPAFATVTLQFAKLEEGENFTGFCPSFSTMYDAGYDEGYNQGKADGIEVYGAQTITLNFDNVESLNRLSVGYTDWGYTSYDDFAASTFVLKSSYYEYMGFNVLSSGYIPIVDISTGQNIGIAIWISRDVLQGDNLPANYITLSVYASNCSLAIVDDAYEPPYYSDPPFIYRIDTEVTLSITRNISYILDEYKEVTYNNGFTAGRSSGYTSGYNQGKADGFTLANDVGSNRGWLGFFSAFVDVPVRVLTSLLDFDFFGFNLFNLVKILVFVALFYLVIRLITKGKVAS